MSWHFFVAYFEKFRHLISPAGVDSAPDPRSWMANWDYQKKMDILRIVDCSVTLREKPWRERFEKYRKRWNFRDFWWFFTNSGGGRSGCGLEIWTYTIFGSISMSETQNFKNIGWSHGLQGRKSESTTPHLRGCVLELACRRSDRPGRSRNLGNRKKRTNARAASVQMCGIVIFSGSFNWRRNHDEIDPKITMKSRIWTFEIGSNVRELTLASR